MRKKITDYVIFDILGEPVIEEDMRKLEKIRGLIGGTQDSAALIIGAGMSIPAGLPTWNNLLAKCLGYQFALQEKGMSDPRFKQMYPVGKPIEELPSLPRCAAEEPYDQTLTSLRDSQPAFPFAYQAVIDSLSDGRGQLGSKTNLLEIGEYLRPVDGAMNFLAAQRIGELGVAALVQQCTQTTMSITDIVKSPLGKLTGLLKSDTKEGITEVVNYNFDTLFEACLESDKSAKIDYKVYHEEQLNHGKDPEVYIYHVHGIAPTDGHTANLSATPLIFTEDSYYAGEKDVLSWPFRLQNDLLLRKSCLLFGFSGQDYNFRRIVKIQKAHSDFGGKTQTHYLFMPVQDVLSEIDGLFDKGATSGSEELCERLIINFLCALKARYWSTYRIEIVWTSYQELGTMIDYLAGNMDFDALKNKLLPGKVL